LHSGLGKLFANGCGRIVVDFVGLILPELADKVWAGRRRSLLIGRLLEDETAAGALIQAKVPFRLWTSARVTSSGMMCVICLSRRSMYLSLKIE